MQFQHHSIISDHMKLSVHRDLCRIKILKSSNQNVMSHTCAFFVIFCKKWQVPNTSDKSKTHLDELKVSLGNHRKLKLGDLIDISTIIQFTILENLNVHY